MVKLTLGSVGVGSGVGHGKVHGSLVLELEVLVLELFAVDDSPPIPLPMVKSPPWIICLLLRKI